MEMKQLKCEDVIEHRLYERIKDIKHILNSYDPIEELNNIALCYEDDPHYRAI